MKKKNIYIIGAEKTVSLERTTERARGKHNKCLSEKPAL